MRALSLLFLLLAAAFSGCASDGLLDSDGDGWTDADEVRIGTDPRDATDFPIDLDGDGIADIEDDDIRLPVPPLAFLPSVDLVCPDYPIYVQGGCGQFGEPQLEVAGDGTIWYSAVCCVGQSPPIWRSFDGGLTFEPLPLADGTGAARDAFGIEGDFAIDDAGNVFFFDISAATAYFTKYRGDGTNVHTKPDVFPPLVDRPWVRAGVEDEVFIAYNTGFAERFYRSIDGGLTWDHLGSTEFPCGLMALGQGPVRDHLIVGGCAGDPSAWISLDGGRTWGQRIHLPLPSSQSATEQYMQPAADAAATTYVPVTHTVDDGADGRNTMISVFSIAANGTVAGPHAASFAEGLVDKPWLVAGKQGVVAMAYYGARNVTAAEAGDKAVWHLYITYSLDADAPLPTWHTVIADPEQVHTGAFGRSLGDFLQLRQTPDGDLVVAYAHRAASPTVSCARRASTSAPTSSATANVQAPTTDAWPSSRSASASARPPAPLGR